MTGSRNRVGVAERKSPAAPTRSVSKRRNQAAQRQRGEPLATDVIALSDAATGRERAIRALLVGTSRLNWSAKLLTTLIEELYVADEFDALLGDPRQMPQKRYAQAVAVALALRHSWRADDFSWICRRLGLKSFGK